MGFEEPPEELRANYRELKSVDGKVVGCICIECDRLYGRPHFPNCNIGSGRYSMNDKELRKIQQSFGCDHALAMLQQVRQRATEEQAGLIDLQLVRETEQRVRRETLEWILGQTNTLDANIFEIVTEELRRAAESEPPDATTTGESQ